VKPYCYVVRIRTLNF